MSKESKGEGQENKKNVVVSNFQILQDLLLLQSQSYKQYMFPEQRSSFSPFFLLIQHWKGLQALLIQNQEVKIRKY